MRKKLTVHRKGYTFKKGKAKGTYVKPTTYKMEDLGAPGRGKEVIPQESLAKIPLGIKFNWSAEKRRAKYIPLVEKYGETSVMNKVGAIGILEKRTNPDVFKKAMLDKRWIAKHFVGKKKAWSRLKP